MDLYSELLFEEADEAQEFHQRTVGADFELIKIDPGTMGFGTNWAALPDLLIVWCHANGEARWRSRHNNGLPNFFFALDGQQRFLGHDLSPDHAGFGNAKGMREGSFRNGIKTLDITVSKEMSDRLGWTIAQDDIRQTDPQALKRLRAICHQASLRARALNRDNIPDWPAGEADRWQGMILDALETAARPWLSGWNNNGSITNHHRILLDAEQFLNEHIPAGPVAVTDLANHLGVPERTLFYSFRRSMGLGPRRYMELLRLREFRRQLLSADPSDNRVLEIAAGLGFNEFGRLAHKYRHQYGELPSDTLHKG